MHKSKQTQSTECVSLKRRLWGSKCLVWTWEFFPTREITLERLFQHICPLRSVFFPCRGLESEQAYMGHSRRRRVCCSERTRIQGADGAPNERCGRVRGRRTQTAQKASHLEQCAGETHLVPSLLKILPADAVGDLACKGRIHREISMHAACFRRKLWRAVKSSRACVPHSVIFSVRDQDKREWSIRPTVSWWLKESNPVGPA